MKKIAALCGILIAFLSTSLAFSTQSYSQISQDEAAERTAGEDNYIIVDVRRQDEFAVGHIPGAICIPNETIGTAQPEELPDLNQTILIYCRSGNRSKQAAQKLADMGYTNLYEFGGINTWTGEIVTGENGIWTDTELPVKLEYLRLDETLISAVSEDPEQIGTAVEALRSLKVGEKNDMETLDQGDYLTFTFEDGRSVFLEFVGDNWITKNKERYAVEGLSELHAVFDEIYEGGKKAR